jgi:Tol biopolymer transport system component
VMSFGNPQKIPQCFYTSEGYWFMNANRNYPGKARRSNCTSYRLLAILFGLLSCVTATKAAEPFQLVSGPNSSPPPSSGGGDSFLPVISQDGRYVLFASSADNLAVNSNNTPFSPLFPGVQNVFLRDRTNGTTTLVSINLSGTGGGNADSFPMAISTNGQFALFESTASNLFAATSNFYNNVFIRDVVNGATLLVSVNTNGIGGNGSSRSSSMSPDGRYVAFVSASSDLVPGDANNIEDIFVRDMQLGSTVLASPGAISAAPYGSDFPKISPDGHYVAFFSTATNLIPGITNRAEIYVRDLVAGTTTLASAFSHTVLPTVFNITNGVSFNHVISASGQYLAYQTGKSPSNGAPGIVLRYNLVSGFTDTIATNAAAGKLGGETNYHSLDMSADGRFVCFVTNLNTSGTTSAIDVWDALSNSITLASGTLAGNSVPTNTVCDWPVMDASGRFVAFLSSAAGLTSNSVGAGYHLYLRDLQAGATQLLDVDTNGVGSTLNSLTFPRMSTNGQVVAFEAPDGALVPGDSNQAYDVFVRDVANQDTELISIRRNELPSVTPDGRSYLSMSSASTNARYIAFSSDANNLVAIATNGFRNIFVRDLLTDALTLASVDTNGVLPGNGLSSDPAISSDGRYVAFTSSASNLVVNDNNKYLDVFVRDLQLSNTTLVSINTNNTGSGNGDSYSPLISATGRYVLFHGKANNLASGITSTTYENLYWRDLQGGTTRALTTNTSSSVSIIGAMSPNGRYVVSAPNAGPLYLWDLQLNTRLYTNTLSSLTAAAVSPDGTHVAFLTSSHVYAMDLVANTNVILGVPRAPIHGGLRFSGDSRFLVYAALDSTNTNQVYLYDFQQATNQLISMNTNSSAGGLGNSDSPDISSDGRFVAYRSVATNLVAGVSNPSPQIYLYDRTNGTTTLVTTSVYGNSASATRSLAPVFSGDSQTLVFESWSDDLVTQDFNQGSDVLALNLYSSNSAPVFSAAIVYAGPSSSAPTITWQVTPGKSYQVQFKTNLSDPTWQALNGNVTLNGNQATITDQSAVNTQRFYRIVAH